MESPGLIALADALRALGEVTVVAPDSDRSGVAHSISIKHPVRVDAVPGRSVPSFSCTGMPADCVVIGANDLCGGRPDMVVSGINKGANAGDDITYSGTIAAAIEGILVGVPAIAVSLSIDWPVSREYAHFETAAEVAVRMVRELESNPFPPRTLLNINVPNRPQEQIAGIRWTRQGQKIYTDRAERRTDPRGGIYYWVWGSFEAQELGEGTDLQALRDGFVSLTPISLDRTDERTLQKRKA